MVAITHKAPSGPARDSTSKLIRYPDGVHRILTMRAFEWERVRECELAGYPFYEVLDAAQILANEFPTEKGYEADVLANTRYMLMVISSGLYEERMGVTNSAV